MKTFHKDIWSELGVPLVHQAEEFWTTSAKGVLRGMHFQVPPHDHEKTVTCLAGRVLDVLLDLRMDERTFGQVWASELSPENARVLVIPKGIAHGFLSLEEASLVFYKASTVHNPQCDCGIRWDSFGFQWPVKVPIQSERDRTLPKLVDFKSPF